MLFKNIFNILLLSLILTTVLITIISYIIFRIRQLAGQKSIKGLYNLNGIYFNRYSPLLEAKNKKIELVDEEKKRDKISTKAKLIVVFSLAFFIVTLLLSLENHFYYRQEVLERTNSAKEYRELINKGLMKKYSFNTEKLFSHPEQRLTPYQKSEYQNMILKLQSFEIKVFESVNDLKYKRFKNSIAINNWLAFCGRNKLKCKKTKRLIHSSDKTILIIPNVELMSTREREEIGKIKKRNDSVVIVGQIGFLNGLGKKSTNNDIVSDLFNLKLGNGKSYPFIDLEKFGISGDNLPESNALSYQTSYIDSVTLQNPFFKFYKNLLWIVENPVLEVNKFEDSYSDFMFLKLLSYKIESYSISIIPKQSIEKQVAIAMLISPNMEHDFLIDLLQKHTKNITLISESNFFPEDFINLNTDLAIFGDSFNSKEQTTRSIFDQIEKYRFNFEEQSHKPVDGVWFFTTKVTNSTKNALLQNHIKYIEHVGRSTVSDYAFSINDGMWNYLDIEILDKAIIGKRDVKSVSDAIAVVKEILLNNSNNQEVTRILLTESLYKTPFNQKFLEELLESVLSKYNSTSFSQIVRYQNSIKDLQVKFRRFNNKVNLEINNPGSKSIKTLNLLYKSQALKVLMSDEYDLSNYKSNQMITLYDIRAGINKFVLKIK